MKRALRVLILLLLLFFVVADNWLKQWRTTDWDLPLWVVLYPIAGDDSVATRSYVDGLRESHFADLQLFFEREAARYALPLDTPFVFKLGPEIKEQPPKLPQSTSALEMMWWSLRMRWWSWNNDSYDGPASMSLYVVYHDSNGARRLEHSVGLRKGLTGVVNAFSDPRERGSNHVVIAHELLHLVGASDKYALQSLQPIFPVGYAEPERQPRYPQRFAELMAGRTPISAQRAEIPRTLGRVVIGETTAAEIRWRPLP